nr:PrpF domain-containing protein [Acidaminococcus intestini]
MCTAAAAAIPGTLVHSILSPCGKLQEIRIGHGSGTLVCGVEAEKGQTIPFIKRNVWVSNGPSIDERRSPYFLLNPLLVRRHHDGSILDFIDCSCRCRCHWVYQKSQYRLLFH